jgi:hypothetical protein
VLPERPRAKVHPQCDGAECVVRGDQPNVAVPVLSVGEVYELAAGGEIIFT